MDSPVTIPPEKSNEDVYELEDYIYFLKHCLAQTFGVPTYLLGVNIKESEIITEDVEYTEVQDAIGSGEGCKTEE